MIGIENAPRRDGDDNAASWELFVGILASDSDFFERFRNVNKPKIAHERADA